MSEPSPKRRYPKFWERAVPIAVVIIGLLVLALLVFIFVVVFGQPAPTA